MILSHVVAVSENGVIGSNNALPWDIPEDFKFFKDITTGHIMIMGRKTYESLPGSKALPKRLHIVISRNPDFELPDAITVTSFEAAVAEAKKNLREYPEEVFVIGGGQIYQQTMDQVDRIYLTLIKKKFKGETVYPLESLKDFELVARRDRTSPVPFSFLTYSRT